VLAGPSTQRIAEVHRATEKTDGADLYILFPGDSGFNLNLAWNFLAFQMYKIAATEFMIRQIQKKIKAYL